MGAVVTLQAVWCMLAANRLMRGRVITVDGEAA